MEGIERIQLKRNRIALAVCELKFPTVPEIEDGVPTSFLKALRKLYPHPSRKVNFNINGLEREVRQDLRHVMHSPKRDWAVAIHASGLSLETSKYTSFADFSSRLRPVVEAASKVMDSDFFTRVGLRYINQLPPDAVERGWLNPKLVAPITGDGPMSKRSNSRFWQEIFGELDDDTGHFAFRHGFEASRAVSGERAPYVVDIDVSCEMVESSATFHLLENFNKASFGFFWWALADAGRKEMEAGDAA